jgi:hypothetical protein
MRVAGQLIVAAALSAGAITGVSPAGAAPTSSGGTAEAKAALNCAPMDQASIIRLYKAYFLRDPDAGGLAYWTLILRGRVADLSVISQYFSTSAEFQARYSNLTDREFVSLVYNNVMSRPPDQAGLDYWTGLLASRTLTRGLVMLSFSESPEFKERVDIWPAPQPAGDPQMLPQSVPLTLHPGRITEKAEATSINTTLLYTYPDTVSVDEIYQYTVDQLQCPGWKHLVDIGRIIWVEAPNLMRIAFTYGTTEDGVRFGYVAVTEGRY